MESIAMTNSALIFKAITQSSERAEILKWMIHDQISCNQNIAVILSLAAVDSDWEVRMAALIYIARFGDESLSKTLEAIKVPTPDKECLKQMDTSILKCMKKIAQMELSKRVTKSHFDKKYPINQADKWQSLINATMQQGKIKPDRAAMLIHSLSTPLIFQPPVQLPQSIKLLDGDYYLSTTGIEMIWVSPIEHWIGDEFEPSGTSVHIIKPEKGFFMNKYPFEDLSISSKKFQLVSYEEAERVCLDLSDLEGVQLELPTHEEWEMAARGPNGFRYPWGNNCQKAETSNISPWGAKYMTGTLYQWTKSTTLSNLHICCGGHSRMQCHDQKSTSKHDKCGIRFVIKN